MKTNLIFKKQVTIENQVKIITRIVNVDVPFINSGEGWILSGHCDEVELAENTIAATVTNMMQDKKSSAESKTKTKSTAKFISDVQGTAKLIRSKGVIKIVAREGKATYNQTTPNSICISDADKQEFFNQCRSYHGNRGIYEFNTNHVLPYNSWNSYIDKEYVRQKKRCTEED